VKVEPLNLRREDISDLSKGQDIERLFRTLNAFGSSTGQAMKSGLTFADNMQAFVKEIKVTMTTDAHTIAATAPYTGTITYRKDRDGFVHLGGNITLNAAATGAALGSLPTGFQPKTAIIAPAMAQPAFVATSFTCSTAGAMAMNWPAGPTLISLDGISFDSSDRRPDVNSGFPVTFTNELAGKSKPVGCWVWQATDLSDQRASPVCAGPVAWELSSKGDQIVVRDIANLPPGREYKIRLVVVAG
jgi:hypothetical protein